MSFWRRVKEVVSGDAAQGEAAGASSALHVIDAAGLATGDGRERLSPRDQFALIKQVAAFTEREKIRCVVLVDGRPLREVPDGGTYKKVTVHYVEGEQGLIDRALSLASGDALLVTQNKKLEQQAQAAGIETLRSQTLRKAWDNGGGRADSDKRSGGRGGRRRGRGRRGGHSRKPAAQDTKASNTAPASTPPQKGKAGDGVSDLIDLV